jgi:molecular chaperone DnaK
LKRTDKRRFEKLCEKLISRCRIPVEKALTDARLDKADINEVVLVGGLTHSCYSKFS